MGSSSDEPNKGIDSSVGGLVWVRRRNGSWWPGRIIGPEELPEGLLPAPRSGTPVKLLGRDDASVDWYNLEKSKRVKAFRCGQYDDCIEKAKASASSLCKKTVKYARREDAILHALQLEGSILEKDDHPNEQQIEENIDDNLRLSEDESNSDSDSTQELSQSGVSFEEPNHVSSKKSLKTPNDSEEDGMERGVKRMKGLDDLGLGVKKKRSRISNGQEFSKRKNRRRTLTKVMECTPVVPCLAGPSVPVLLESNDSKENNFFENGTSLDESNRANDDVSLACKEKGNESPVLNESFESFFDVPLAVEEKHPAGLSTIVPDIRNIIPSIKKSTSDWQLKRKRNSRSRKIDSYDESEPFFASIRDADPTIAPHRSLPYRQSRFTVNPKYDSSEFPHKHHNNFANSTLYNVPIEIETSYRPRHVPYISLMSKSSRKPIIGHPITIEELSDGYCDQFFILVPKFRKPKNGLLCKKTRKLSSLNSSSGRNREEKRKSVVEKIIKGPCVACVPLKVVFSRINAALNSSSIRNAPRLSLQ